MSALIELHMENSNKNRNRNRLVDMTKSGIKSSSTYDHDFYANQSTAGLKLKGCRKQEGIPIGIMGAARQKKSHG